MIFTIDCTKDFASVQFINVYKYNVNIYHQSLHMARNNGRRENFECANTPERFSCY